MTPLWRGRLIQVALIALLWEGGMTTTRANESRVDFSYAFATPHRITVARPDSGDKTLLDCHPGFVRMAWSYDDLTRYPLAAFKTPPTQWSVRLHPEVDGAPFARSRWTRAEGWLPVLENVYEQDGCSVRVEIAGGASAAVARIELTNRSDRPRRFTLRGESEAWGENPAWVAPDREPGDCLKAGWVERADRVLLLGLGADTYTNREDRRSPGPRMLLMVWDLKPDETRTAWIARPYRAYAADLPALRARDWAKELEEAKREWRSRLTPAMRVTIPDPGVENAYRAGLADLFVMREPVAQGYLAATPGTEVYRAPNAFEAAVLAVALDQAGLHREAERGYRMCLEMQEPDGEWADPKGWGHLMWGGSGFKAWAAMEHYRLTGDRDYLAKVYPRMEASTRWQEKQRARTRVAAGSERPLTYGLMPRGMGDAGLKDGDDLYGVFLPHNIWAVYADRLSVEAAEILGRTEDLPELQRIYETGRDDLMRSLEGGSIAENGYRWIPGVPGKTSGSLWGGLNALYPCGLLPADHPLITGTIRHMEARLSPGGLPIHTGWLENGMWVAITLDNLAEAHLARGDGDPAARYLYAVLNHGTPLYSWCEERGPEPGTAQCTGDRQHLWTPVAVARVVRDMLVMERGDELHMALGTAREWLGGGGPLGVAKAPTHFGRVGWEMRYDAPQNRVSGRVVFGDGFRARRAVLHVRLPGGLRVATVNASSGARVLPGGAGLAWDAPRGTARFEADVTREEAK